MHQIIVLLVLVALIGCATSNSESDTGKMLSIGTTAPLFKAVDDSEKEIVLQDLLNQTNVVLIFYPMNETPGCTKQLCTARDDWEKYKSKNVMVFGVNPASSESHREFRENYDFPFPLLADVNKEIVRAYGTEGFIATKRTVYGIDKSGKIVFAERGMPSTEEILAAFGESS